jgi:hypothetical protein
MFACSLDFGDELNDEFVNTWINAMGQDTCQNIQNDIDNNIADMYWVIELTNEIAGRFGLEVAYRPVSVADTNGGFEQCAELRGNMVLGSVETIEDSQRQIDDLTNETVHFPCIVVPVKASPKGDSMICTQVTEYGLLVGGFQYADLYDFCNYREDLTRLVQEALET